MLARVSCLDMLGIERFDKWVDNQPKTRDTEILKWCRDYREAELGWK